MNLAMYLGNRIMTMAKIKGHDKWGRPIYDVSELEEYVYSGIKKLYKIPEGGICDRTGKPLGMLDLATLGISLEPEETEPTIGLSDDEIKNRLEQTEDATERKELELRKAYNESVRGERTSIIEPMFGELTRSGEYWAEMIGEEKVKSICHEQDEYFKQLPSEDKISTRLKSLFGVDYYFPVNKRGDAYFVNMIDEDTHECVKFMIENKKIYKLTDENEDDSEQSELENIFRSETDSIIKIIYGE